MVLAGTASVRHVVTIADEGVPAIDRTTAEDDGDPFKVVILQTAQVFKLAPKSTREYVHAACT